MILVRLDDDALAAVREMTGPGRTYLLSIPEDFEHEVEPERFCDELLAALAEPVPVTPDPHLRIVSGMVGLGREPEES